ncbi:15952_t:CDS:10, partial [Acaulospora colombiana]
MTSKTSPEKQKKRRGSMDYMEESDSDTAVERPELSRETSPLPEELKPESAKFSRAKLRDYISYATSGRGLASSAKITDDGRILVSLDLKKALPDLPKDYANPVREFAIDPALEKHLSGIIEPPEIREGGMIPVMNIVIMIVGDVQPYLALGQQLKKEGHRVRIATHETFRSFVTENDLEFYNIGGDPKELMSYMVRRLASLTNGDIGRKRKMLSEILVGCWEACTQSDPSNPKGFVADAIISNPPAFAHVHCAEALGVPLQMTFTMPWCPTVDFPHPLVNVSESNAEVGLTNYLSYALAEIMTWKGLGDVINKFRQKSLGLDPLSIRSGPGIADRLKVPWTYCFSPSLVPKPLDWKNHIAGPPPIYIGFGSVVVEDPAKMTNAIFEATAQAGVRALVSAGWGGLGGVTVPSHVHILGNVPHDWLFTKVFAVCHHGGAGTTAIGLRLGKPTIVVPFFGDQPFWGTMIHKAGAGPHPIKKDKLNVETLKKAIEFCKTEGATKAAEVLGEKIRAHVGLLASSMLTLINVLDVICYPRDWQSGGAPHIAFAAEVLAEEKLIDMSKLEPHRAKEYESKAKSKDPLSGGSIEIFRTITHYYGGIGQIFYSPVKGIINTTTAIPSGVVEIVGAIQEGFHNLPTVYGSKVRKPGKVKDAQSGKKSVQLSFHKGLFYGYADAITGLVTEPFEGAKKEQAEAVSSPKGGSLQSIVGAIAHPVTGAWMSMKKLGGMRAAEHRVHQIRIQQGREAIVSSDLSLDDRQRVIEAFKKACLAENEKNRRKTMEERIQEAIAQGGAGTMTVDDSKQTIPAANPVERGATATTAAPNQAPALPPRPTEAKLEIPLSKLAPDAAEVSSPAEWGEAEEAEFQRQLEAAKAASLAATNNDPNDLRAAGGKGEGSSEPGHQGRETELIDEQFERELRSAMEASLAEQRAYERGLLQAAAQWREGEGDYADPPPPYYREYEEERDELSDLKTQNQSGLKSKASLSRDGRISVTMHLNKALPDLPIGYANPVREFAVDPSLAAPVHGPRKGDVQPFLALGLDLHRHGHRVRIATHGTFRQFVKDTGLEFYDIGGDPHDLMSYMVKNPGLMPGWASLTNGDIRKKQKMLGQILEGCWNACFQPDTDQVPFIADAIISNPPAFAHVHCAEALVAFPHPLVNISQSNAEPGLTNFLTYGLAEMMTWQG